MIKEGEKYGMLTVIKKAGRTSYGRQQFECLCDCGNYKIAEASNIERGHTRSCGCFRDQMWFKHGMCNSQEYHSWCALRSRCYNENNNKYSDYGGRGITVCDRWLESFENFFEDMGKKPCGRYSIERIDNDGNYEPENCKWATPAEQCHNQRSNHFLEYNNESHPISEWEKILGFNGGTVKARIYHGWNVEKALTTPVRKTRRWYNES